jgi:hypothetical protein
LVEALVSAAIVSAVLGVTFEAVSGAEFRRAEVERRRTALLIARSEMAAVGAEIPVVSGETNGVEGDFTWRVRIDPAEGGQTAIGQVGPPELVTVSVRAARGGRDLVVLKSLKLTELP